MTTKAIANQVTYTVPGDGARLEQQTTIVRRRKLTHAGAQRIVRRVLNGAAVVVRIEAMGVQS